MTLFNMLQMMSALSGIALISAGSLLLKAHLKRSFCC